MTCLYHNLMCQTCAALNSVCFASFSPFSNSSARAFHLRDSSSFFSKFSHFSRKSLWDVVKLYTKVDTFNINCTQFLILHPKMLMDFINACNFAWQSKLDSFNFKFSSTDACRSFSRVALSFLSFSTSSWALSNSCWIVEIFWLFPATLAFSALSRSISSFCSTTFFFSFKAIAFN